MASLSPTTTIALLLLLLHLTTSLSSPVPKSPKPQQQPKTSPFDVEKDTQKPSPSPKNQTKPLKPKATNTTTKGATFKPTTTTIDNKKVKLNKTTSATKIDKPLKTTKPTNTTKQLKSQPKPLNATKIAPKTGDTKRLQPSKPIKAPPLQHQRTQNAPKHGDHASGGGAAGAGSGAGALIPDLRTLPARLLPNLERLSTTSKAYIYAANRGIADGVRPLVGNGAAAKVAPFVSSILVAAPLLVLAAAALRRLRVGRLLALAQAYLAVYYATLAAAGAATGLEPLRFLFEASPASYAWTQAVQTLALVVYLVAQLLDLVGSFAGDGAGAGDGGAPATARALALAQMVVGLGVGAHYYADVLERASAGVGPGDTWRVHAVYATCFLVICWMGGAQRRKKLYEGEEDGKKS